MENCTICLSLISERATVDCGHAFCYDCIRQWCKVSNTCPQCRLGVRTLFYKKRRRKVKVPKISYESWINNYLYGEEVRLRRLTYDEQPELRGFVVADHEASEDDYGSGNSDE